MPPKVIACRVMIDEIRLFLPEGVETEVFDISLHTRPKVLKEGLQAAIDASDGKYDPILLGYALCSNAVVGLKAEHSRLVVPRTHDCIGIFLGSQQTYREENNKEPGTYFLTQGWIGDGGSLFSDYERMAAKFGSEKAEYVVREMLRHYKRLVYIRTPKAINLEADRAYARRMAERFSLRYEEIDGNTTLLQRMIAGDWREDFVVTEPGQETSFEQFMVDGT